MISLVVVVVVCAAGDFDLEQVFDASADAVTLAGGVDYRRVHGCQRTHRYQTVFEDERKQVRRQGFQRTSEVIAFSF